MRIKIGKEVVADLELVPDTLLSEEDGISWVMVCPVEDLSGRVGHGVEGREGVGEGRGEERGFIWRVGGVGET